MKTPSIPQTRTVEITERLPVSTGHEVIVAGGGVAGAAAALAAARAGKRVLLIEKATLLGGLSTIGLVNWFVPMCNGRGRKIMSGMVDEFVRLATRDSYDTIPEGWRDGGATGNDYLMQVQSDISDCQVEVSSLCEFSALGVACLSGKGYGLKMVQDDYKVYKRRMSDRLRNMRLSDWRNALAVSQNKSAW